MDEILPLAAERGIPVIEDAAHAVFTRHRGKMLGLHGTIGCFSFYSNKNITCGEGGAVVTDDDALAETVRLLRSHGMTAPTLDRHRGVATSYDVVLAGFNGRLDELRAALLRAQLTRLPEYLDRRRALFARYVDGFRDTPVVVPFSTGRSVDELAETGVHLMPVLLPDRRLRPEVMARLKEARIQTSIHYPPIHRFRMYREPGRDLPRTSDLADRELTLPFFPAMADDDVNRVVEAVLRAVDAAELGRSAA
jgi:dTDP-4-amino-4,6-dideoxygalactose transaminase